MSIGKECFCTCDIVPSIYTQMYGLLTMAQFLPTLDHFRQTVLIIPYKASSLIESFM